jgi:hypothetical protein
MSLVPRCSTCDERIDGYGRQGTRCSRCNTPCPVCSGDIAFCGHPLPVRSVKPERIAA